MPAPCIYSPVPYLDRANFVHIVVYQSKYWSDSLFTLSSNYSKAPALQICGSWALAIFVVYEESMMQPEIFGISALIKL